MDRLSSLDDAWEDVSQRMAQMYDRLAHLTPIDQPCRHNESVLPSLPANVPSSNSREAFNRNTQKLIERLKIFSVKNMDLGALDEHEGSLSDMTSTPAEKTSTPRDEYLSYIKPHSKQNQHISTQQTT